ncbi:putative interleukin-17 receptor E-like [Pristis pectinata]|uniref:putative interleukin-17 receptor E-like n=1 Tax=Pristis pectinata TaxID=685728 RepID=UPI00223DA467|nr:putative interleukin-17 receptor E-like [Pristis pectinata]
MHSLRSYRLNCFLTTLGLLISSSQAVEYITKCGLRCSQGLQCKSKNRTLSYQYSSCLEQPSSMPSKILEDLKIFTVLKCVKEKQCSIFLNVKGTLLLNEHIRGVEICSSSMSTFQYQCLTVKFNKHNYKELAAQPVFIEYDCFSTSMAEYNAVTIKTIPHYCGVLLKQEHRVEDCTDKDIGRNIPTCIVGKLDYDIDKSQKTLSVQASDFLEDYAYHVRLCLKWFTCEDLGTSALIEVEDLKNVTLPYSQILPCLCIEGWSALPDARRIQLCPFKNYTEELWNGLTYNHKLQELSWEPSCPVDVNVNLCWMSESNENCIDLQNSFHKVQHKVTYSRIDPHPKLCIKFTTDKGSWVRCPFAYGYLPAWNMSITEQLNKLQLTFVTQDKAEFKMALCNRTAANKCEPIKELYITAGTMGVYSEVFNFPYDERDSNICVQGWRTDIEYSVRIQICGMLSKENYTKASPQFLWPMAITAILLITVTLVIFTGYMLFTALQPPYQKVFLYSSQLSRSIDVDVKEISHF